MISKAKYLMGFVAVAGMAVTGFALKDNDYVISRFRVASNSELIANGPDVYLDDRGVQEQKPVEPVKRQKPAEVEVHGLYLTASSAGSEKKLDDTVQLLKDGGLNALIIDLKDFSGGVYFDTQVPVAIELGTVRNKYTDLSATIKKLHDQGVYVIARITVFQDPLLAEKKPEWAIKDSVTGGSWHDYKGLSWVDPTVNEVWQYNIDLAKDAVRFGFDEINFDYIRFPSDGAINRMVFKNWHNNFPKHEMISGFFASLHIQLKNEPVYLSADLFGLTTIRKDDMNIGQSIEDASIFFHYVCPMMYPSHYPSGFMNFSNPADHPYEIIKSGLEIANKRLSKVDGRIAKIRPWIQDFDIGAYYDRVKIQQQIKAVVDGGGYGYLSWNARNVYIASEYK